MMKHSLVILLGLVLIFQHNGTAAQVNISSQVLSISSGNFTNFNQALVNLETALPLLNWTQIPKLVTTGNAELIMTRQNSPINSIYFNKTTVNYTSTSPSPFQVVYLYELTLSANVTKRIAPQKLSGSSVSMVTPSASWYISVSVFSSTTVATSNSSLPTRVTYTGNVTMDLNTCKRLQNIVAAEASNLPGPLKLKVMSIQPVCAYVDPLTYNYSTKQCTTVIHSAIGSVTCHCNHMTVFTSLISVQTATVPLGVKIISYILESLSVLSLVATVAILLIHKTDDRSVIQINLSLALLFVHVADLADDIGARDTSSCVFEAFVFHLFIIATGMFLLLDAIRVWAAIWNPLVFRVGDANCRNTGFIIVGWSVSLFIVVLAVGIGVPNNTYLALNPLFTACQANPNTILKYDTCRCAIGTVSFGASIIMPLTLFMLATFAALARAKWTRVYGTPEEGVVDEEKIRFARDVDEAIRSIFILAVVFTIAWIFGFASGFGNVSASPVLLYFYTIATGFQGLSLFVIYCLTDKTLTFKSPEQ